MARILLADADEKVRHAFAIRLGNLGHEVWEANDAAAARAILAEQSIDLLISERTYGQETTVIAADDEGFAVIREAAEKNPMLKAILFTSISGAQGNVMEKHLEGTPTTLLDKDWTLRDPKNKPGELERVVQQCLGGEQLKR